MDIYRFASTLTCRIQSCCFAQSFPSTSSVSTEQISDHAFSSTGKLVAQMNEQLDCEFSLEVVCVLTKPPEIDVPARRNPSRPPIPQSNLVSKMFVPNDQRKWDGIPAVDYVSRRSFPWRVSKIMTKMLRLHGSHREDDGAIDWNSFSVMPRFRKRECLEMVQ